MKTPQLFDPDATSSRWKTLKPHVKTRGYHSAALLLPDGRIFLGGGSHPAREPSIEMFRPPYLFDAAGNYPVQSRPEIAGELTKLVYDETSELTLGGNYANEIEQVNLLRLGAATHGFDQDQRFVPLKSAVTSANALKIHAPENAQLAPPGYYMLFVLRTGDRPGILFPSRAKIVEVAKE